MKLREMSDEELAHWITMAKEANQMYSFPNEGPSTQRPGATTTVAYTRYTLLELAHEAARRLTAKSDWIPRPKIETAGVDKSYPDALWVNDGFLMGFSSAFVAWQHRERLMHLLGMEGGEGG